jgi:hypothetical protein
LFLAVRSPRRNGGAVELWRLSGSAGVGTPTGSSTGSSMPGSSMSGSIGKQTEQTEPTDEDVLYDHARLLQATTPFGAAVAASSAAAATALAVAASKCYLLTPDGTLREVLAQ